MSPNSTDLVQKDDFDSIVMGIMKNFEQNNLPDSISILINFGTEKSHLLYDADQVFSQLYYVAFCMCISYVLAFVYMYFHLYLHLKLYLYLHLHLHEQANHACSCHQIWDPFSEMCHDIFCSTGQVNGHGSTRPDLDKHYP